MSKKIKVILLEDVESYGRSGEIVEVSEGYARNFLFPQTKAALATSQVEKQVEKNKSRVEQAEKEQLADSQKQADELDGSELTITARVKDGDEIYGKINKKDIVEALKTQADLTIATKDIGLAKPIASLGTYDVIVNLPNGVDTKIKIFVEADPDSLPKTEE